MANAAFFAGFLTLVLCSQVFAQSEPVVSPTPTPTPPENIKVYNLTLNDSEDPEKICLRMLVAIEVNVTYQAKNQNKSKVIPLTDMASFNRDDTYCHIINTTARVALIPDKDPDEPLPFQLIFEFSGNNKSGDQHWNWGDIVLRIEDTTFLDGYDGGLDDPTDFNTSSRLDDESNSRLEFQRSYKCNTTQTLSFNNTHKIHPFVYVSQLHVQAFRFKNQTGFDDARTCLRDTSGTANKIVPIAVGAALAGLVVVVLIAYLIGRLRSRRQSSYEALS